MLLKKHTQVYMNDVYVRQCILWIQVTVQCNSVVVTLSYNIRTVPNYCMDINEHI